MPERKLFLVPVLIAVEADDTDDATHRATCDIPNVGGFLGGDDERGAYEVPFAGSGRPVTYEQLANPDFSVTVAYGEHWLTNDDDPRTWPYPPKPPKEPSTDET